MWIKTAHWARPNHQCYDKIFITVSNYLLFFVTAALSRAVDERMSKTAIWSKCMYHAVERATIYLIKAL